MASTIARQLAERRSVALDEFRRDKKRRQNMRVHVICRSNSLPVSDNSTSSRTGGGAAIRTKYLVTGQNFRPSIDRSTSAPRLGLITEDIEEEPATVDRMADRRQSLLALSCSNSTARLSLCSSSSAVLKLDEHDEDLQRHEDDNGIIFKFVIFTSYILLLCRVSQTARRAIL